MKPVKILWTESELAQSFKANFISWENLRYTENIIFHLKDLALFFIKSMVVVELGGTVNRSSGNVNF